MKMTNEEAIHILMNLDKYVEHIEDVGIGVKAPLVDATLLAIRALRNNVTPNNTVPYPLGGMIYYVETTEESDEAWIANKPIQYIDEEGYHCGWGLATLCFKFEELNEVYFFSYEEAKANLGIEEDEDESILQD